MSQTIAVVGAGFSGAVVAHLLAKTGSYKVTVFEGKGHIAGNCYTVRDPDTGVLLHQYGPHIFHTRRDDVWKFVTGLAEFGPFTNRVKAHTARGVFSLPMNLLTINQFYGKRFNPEEAKAFLKQIGDQTIDKPSNFEEQALKFVGRDLYETFFRGYTLKQWGVDPRLLPASILQRLPMRFSYEDNYYSDPYQGIPKGGYSSMIAQLLDHKKVEVLLNTTFAPQEVAQFDHVFYCGTLDGFYGYRLGRLRYRTLQFERIDAAGDFQGNAVINYCEETVPFTRITEHKHFAPWESHERTVCFREFSKETGRDDIPYYPMRLEADKKMLLGYMALAEAEENVTFLGRLGTYRYLDMDTCIGEAMDVARRFMTWGGKGKFSAFSVPPVAPAG